VEKFLKYMMWTAALDISFVYTHSFGFHSWKTGMCKTILWNHGFGWLHRGTPTEKLWFFQNFFRWVY
jgi:hypothetical protein